MIHLAVDTSWSSSHPIVQAVKEVEVQCFWSEANQIYEIVSFDALRYEHCYQFYCQAVRGRHTGSTEVANLVVTQPTFDEAETQRLIRKGMKTFGYGDDWCLLAGSRTSTDVELEF